MRELDVDRALLVRELVTQELRGRELRLLRRQSGVTRDQPAKHPTPPGRQRVDIRLLVLACTLRRGQFEGDRGTVLIRVRDPPLDPRELAEIRAHPCEL